VAHFKFIAVSRCVLANLFRKFEEKSGHAILRGGLLATDRNRKLPRSGLAGAGHTSEASAGGNLRIIFRGRTEDGKVLQDVSLLPFPLKN